MIALRTVVPDGISVVDGDGESRGRLSTGDLNEAGVEAIVYGCTGTGVATTSNTMGAGIEVESDSVADSSSGRVGGEDQTAFTNVNGMGRSISSSQERRNEWQSVRLHVELAKLLGSSFEAGGGGGGGV